MSLAVWCLVFELIVSIISIFPELKQCKWVWDFWHCKWVWDFFVLLFIHVQAGRSSMNVIKIISSSSLDLYGHGNVLISCLAWMSLAESWGLIYCCMHKNEENWVQQLMLLQVVVFDSSTEGRDNSSVNATAEADENESGALFLVRILKFLETPQYLRRSLFPKHNSLRYVV